jgi:hypothetical protein
MRLFADKGGTLYLYKRHYDGRFNVSLRRRHIPVVPDTNEARTILAGPEPAAILFEWRVNPENPAERPLGEGVGHIVGWGYLGDDRMCLLGNDAAAAIYPGDGEPDRTSR